MEALTDIDGESLFKAPIEDVNRYAVENGFTSKQNEKHLYHTPCHDSLKGSAQKLFQQNSVYQLQAVPHAVLKQGRWL